MPYRLDIPDPPDHALDDLVRLGALDVESTPHGLAALLPDRVGPDEVADALHIEALSVSPITAYDDGSVWVLRRRPFRAGGLLIVPAETAAEPRALRLIDSPAFGTGLHPTTALCLEALAGMLEGGGASEILDVGTGSGVLALAALLHGVPRAVGVDIDERALHAATANARANGLSGRVRLVRGGPDAVAGSWPLVVANVLAAPLIDLAPAMVRRVGHDGRLILGGIARSVAADVERTYRRLGMRPLQSDTRDGWTMLVLGASW